MQISKNSNEIFNQTEIKEFSEFFDLPKFAVEHLFYKGIKTKQDIADFINPSLEKLHNPFDLNGMSQAVERIQRAINNKEKILIFGDYDVDGISAITILYRYLKNCHAEVNYYIPSRNDDGYGLNIDTMKYCMSRFQPNLIITVDCGISCHDEIEFLKKNNIDCIVTDHHEIPEVIPETIVVNAKLPNQNYPFKELCGTGVAFKLVCALSGKIMEVFLPIVAIATISDIVPLIDENRILTYYGLKLWEQYAPYGIKKLCKTLDLTTITAQEVSYKLAPRINAPGRLGSPIDAVNLYLEKNDTEIDRIINKITEINNQRQEYCTIVVNDVKQMLEKIDLNNTNAIILKNEKWEAGILGIACARISEEYCRPTFLFSKINGVYKGSGRSYGGINICKAITECSQYLEHFGGHSAAVGLEVKINCFEQFAEQLNNHIKNNYPASVFTPIKYYDIDLDINELSLINFTKLEKLEPFGFGNSRPLFKITLTKQQINSASLTKNAHLVIKYGKLDAIGFNMQPQLKVLKNSSCADIVVDTQINIYNNRKFLKSKIQAISVKDFNFESSFYFECLYALQNFENVKINKKGNYTLINPEVLENLKNSAFGTVYLCSTNKGYKRYKELKNMFNINNIEYHQVQNKSLINSLVYQPEINKLNRYKNYVVLDDLYDLNYFSSVDADNKHFFYFEKINKKYVNILNVSTEREEFKNYFICIKSMLNKRKIYNNIIDAFFVFQKLNPQLQNSNFMQFAFCFKVFMQLGIIEEQLVVNGYKYIITNINSDLNNSVLYTNIKSIKTGEYENR